MSKRKAEPTAVAAVSSNDVEISPLGAGNEVGRSCIILKYQGKNVMFDCGIHPGHSGLNSLPYLDETDVSALDVALITHFHLDHCAAVPYLLRKTKFKGRIFMTHPTKAIYHALLRDFARQSKGSSDEQLYNEEDLDATMDQIEVIDFHQTLEVNDILITPFRAGHVLGAAMFMVEIAGMKCLYTGDYSRIPDRHLPAADIPLIKPDIVIIESTYGVSRHQPREARESAFLNRIYSTIKRKGRVLLPVVALGRAQELLLMLDEFWEKRPELHDVPIYQASGMMRKAMTVFQTYVEMMNDDIKQVFNDHNPFAFKHVTHLKNSQQFDDIGPCVMMATPSGLQSGISRDVFDAWCDDANNAVIICDFAVAGTLARDILGGPASVLTRQGVKKPLRCSVDHISFSAHADFDQTSGFLDTVQPMHVVLVHGEVTEMGRLKSALERGAAALNITRNVYMPRNVQTVQIQHKPLRLVRLVGRLADKPPKEGQTIKGVLVSSSSRSSGGNHLLHPDDLPVYTKLYKGRVTQRQALIVNKTFSDIRLALEVMFEGVEGAGTLPVSSIPVPASSSGTMPTTAGPAEPTPGPAAAPADAAAAAATSSAVASVLRSGALQEGESQAVSVGEHVTVTYKQGGARVGYETHMVLEWEGGRVGDMVADAVVAVILQAEGEPSAAAAADAARHAAQLRGDARAAEQAEVQLIAALMRAQFGPAIVDVKRGVVEVMVDSQPVSIDHKSSKVRCKDEQLKARVEKALLRITEAMRPCSLDTQV